jgi:hypothetical protein
MPPASSNKPTIASNCVVIAAKPMRSTVAAMMPIRIALARCSFGRPGGRETDDDGVVAGQHEVDHDDLAERDPRVPGIRA